MNDMTPATVTPDMDRPEHFDPRKFRRGVGLMIRNPDGLFLAGKPRPREGERLEDQMWQLPQGGKEKRRGVWEPAVNAGYREMREEVGLRRRQVIFRCVLPMTTIYWWPEEKLKEQRKRRGAARYWEGQWHEWMLVDYPKRPLPNLKAATTHELMELRWLPLEELAACCMPMRARPYRCLIGQMTRAAAGD